MTADRFIIYPQAADDFEAIQEYISKGSPETGQRFVDRVFATMQDLLQFPESNPLLEHPGLEKRSLRRAIVADFPNHLIVYEYTGEVVLVLRAFHAAQNWQHDLVAPDD